MKAISITELKDEILKGGLFAALGKDGFMTCEDEVEAQYLAFNHLTTGHYLLWEFKSPAEAILLREVESSLSDYLKIIIELKQRGGIVSYKGAPVRYDSELDRKQEINAAMIRSAKRDIARLEKKKEICSKMLDLQKELDATEGGEVYGEQNA